MLKVINISEIIVAIALIVSILMQSRGAGLSQTFGGDFGGYYTRRGFERFLVVFSVILSALFIGLAIANLVISSRGI
ncbi:MAG TPA: preprotein translocase subunit SecG [Candidatus Moranbacteria bacterium]|nr:preprotein translocase subunit SecG [Candidatus Moranbacteria bacterium]